MNQVGKASDSAQLKLLKAKASQVIAGGQGGLELGLGPPVRAVLPITSNRMAHLVYALARAYGQLGFEAATQGDEVFRQLVLARLIEPTSKQDSLRVLGEVGVKTVSHPTLNRRSPVYAAGEFRERPAQACGEQALLGPNALVLFNRSVLMPTST